MHVPNFTWISFIILPEYKINTVLFFIHMKYISALSNAYKNYLDFKLVFISAVCTHFTAVAFRRKLKMQINIIWQCKICISQITSKMLAII